MKTLFWILLLVNLLTFAYFKRDVWAPSKEIATPELNAEQLQVLKESDLAALPARVATTETNALPEMATPESNVASEQNNPQQNHGVAENNVASNVQAPANPKEAEATPAPKNFPEYNTCYEWGSFDNARVNEVVALTEKLGIKYSVHQQTSGVGSRRFWIYKPPMPTAEAAQAKAEELRRLGIEDFFVVQDLKWRNAISFGVFKDEKLADNLIEDLKRKGVRLLVKATRFGGEGNATMQLQHVSAQQLLDLKKTQPQFPDTVLKEIQCQ